MLADLCDETHTNHMLFQELYGDICVIGGTVDMANQPAHDALGFGFNEPSCIVLQDLKLLNIQGGTSDVHPDGAQAYTDVHTWFLNRVLISSYYQCFFTKNMPDRDCLGVRMTDCEFHDLSGKAKPVWLGDYGFAELYEEDGIPRCFLDNVRIKPFENRSLRDCVHPGPDDMWNCTPIGVLTDDDWASCYWPLESGIVGRIVRI
jgi:hypothetical protein